jgi:hypothetical protein
MSRLERNWVVLAKVEATYATDPTPTNSANAMLASKPQINPINSSEVARDVFVGYLGQRENLVGTRFVEASFDVELVGSGTVGTRPAWGDLMLACGWAETATASTRVDYVPISSAFQSVTIYWYDDGALHKLHRRSRRRCQIKADIGGIP